MKVEVPLRRWIKEIFGAGITRRRAFTLLETAIVIGILSLVLSGGLAIYRVQIVKERMDTTRNRLEDIRSALAKYKLQHNDRLPCPALLTDATTAPSFGVEQTDCADSAAAPGTFRHPSPAAAADKVRIGAVPVNALGLSTQHMIDSWGRRFVYAVSEKLADATYTDSAAAKPYDESKWGGIQLLPPNGSTAAADALGPNPLHTPFVILSLGKVGAGGYTYEGKPFLTCPAGGAEEENCNFTVNATFRTATHSDSENPATRFDDIVVNNIGNLAGIATDASLICGNKGKIYGPTALGADSDGCVSSGSGAANMLATSTAVCDSTDPASVPEGSIRYNTETKKPEYCNGKFWIAMGGGCNAGASEPDVQIFTTVGTNSWVKPSCFGKGATVIAECWGGGGQGGSGGGSSSSGGGGGGGGYSRIVDLPMSSITSGSVSVIVGAGSGAFASYPATISPYSPATSPHNGDPGGSSSFGSYFTAGGGGGGSSGGGGGSGGSGNVSNGSAGGSRAGGAPGNPDNALGFGMGGSGAAWCCGTGGPTIASGGAQGKCIITTTDGP